MSTTVISVRGRDRAELLRDPNFVYVGRGIPRAGWKASPWGNPWKEGSDWGGGKLSTYGAVEAFRRALESSTEEKWRKLRLCLPDLRGKVLGCWCGCWEPGGPALTCHAVVLAKLADGPLGDPKEVAKETSGQEWPRLSESLTGPRSPVQCQACGLTSVRKLSRWQEHDRADKPEPIVVVLCESCAKALIEPHERLYRQLDWNEPFPGSMPICADCGRRDGVTCTSPLLLRNGGPGLPVPAADTTLFLDGTRNGRRFGERRKAWSKPMSDCIDKPLIVGIDKMPGEDAGG